MKQYSNGMDPEVTVLMACYNASRWLHEAIESVLAQTFDNFEFILVDDGSMDETWKIIQSYRDRDERIVAIHKENTGLTDSLNVGILKSRGKWIARLDADDICAPTRLEAQVNFIDCHPEVVLLGTGYFEINEQCRIIKKHKYPSDHHKLVHHLEFSKPFFPHSSAFFSRKIVQDIGCYNPLFKKTQDADLWFRLMERGRIACLQNCLVKVRKHTGQISNSTMGTSQFVYLIAAAICHFLRIYGYPDPSRVGENEVWQEFLKWVETRIYQEAVFEKRKAWADARAEYFAMKNKLIGALFFLIRLLQSGHLCSLVREKILGTSLTQRLSWERMKLFHVV